MKIYCDKCKENITLQVNNMFESFKVGQIECLKCKSKQKRYISESDLLLYYGISEILYVVISLITNWILTVTGLALWMIGVIIAILIIYFILQKKLTYEIYVNAKHKIDYKEFVFDEDANEISKNMRWQFILFFGIAIFFIMGDEAKLIFAILLIMSVIFTFIKFYLARKRELDIVNESRLKIKEK